MNDEKTRLRWLVERREKAQRLIHELYLVLTNKDLRIKLEASPNDCSTSGLYVGVAFSLWRSVFLIEATRTTWPTILAGVEKFLGYLIGSNTALTTMPTIRSTRTCKSGISLCFCTPVSSNVM
jgi:hypothetical protein